MKVKYEQELLQAQLEIQEQTLQNISQEIHDNIGQVLSLVKLNLNTVKNLNDATFQESKDLLSKAIVDLRDLSRSMQGDRIVEMGLWEAISEQAITLKNSGRYNTEVKVSGSPYPLPQQKEIIIFRVFQEAINNVIKHAQAGNIFVWMDYMPGELILTIKDDGVGIRHSGKAAGIGLLNMKNRIALINGRFKIDTMPDNNGCQIEITVPV
jgi:signal transduction histidine kinase